MKREFLPRVFITLMGAAFILWAAGSFALDVFGERLFRQNIFTRLNL